MIHVIKIDDEKRKGGQNTNKTSKHSKEADIENPEVSNEIPEGYFTLDEFRKIAIEKGHKFCDEHGII